MKTTLLIAAMICVGMVTATPTGAPTIACDDMTPNHVGTNPQPLPSPYTITLSQARVQPRADVTGEYS